MIDERVAVANTRALIVASLPGVTKVEIEKVQLEENFFQWRTYVEMQPAGYPLLHITDFESSLDTEAQSKIVGRLKDAWEIYRNE